jgi:hypothetical protein
VAHLALWEAEKMLVPDSKPRRARSQVVERLCDEIATELLAPREEIIGNWKAFSVSAQSSGKSPDSLQMIQHLAEEFAISLQMAAIRFVEICKPRAGVGLLDLEKKAFVWCHSVPGRYGLLEFLLQQHGDYKRLLEVKSDTGKARIFSGSATYPLLKKEGRVPAEWRTLSFNPNLCLVIVKPRFAYRGQRLAS